MFLERNYIIAYLFGYILSLGVGVSASAQKEISAFRQNDQTVFEAGTPVKLVFKLNVEAYVELFCLGSYGTTVVKPIKESGNSCFIIPSHIVNKRGVLDYQLFHESNILYKGSLTIVANTKTKPQIASYIGPPSILAGGEDFTMLVVSPTDFYGNPLVDNTTIEIKHQFKEVEKTIEVLSKDFIGWKNLYSYRESGKLLVSSQVQETPSKELAIEVFPSQAIDFEIKINRKHNYADGNQISTLETSVITDRNNNIVSDGTLVEFMIQNNKGHMLKTQGATISGVAKGRMLHPSHPEEWQIQAYVTGMATSNTLKVVYRAITEDYTVTFGPDNRTITVGPLQSFMKQLIPDGAVVKLEVCRDTISVEQLIETSSNGFVTFVLPVDFYPPGKYDLKVLAFGIEKTFNTINL